MCIWDSYVYQKGVLCFRNRESYVGAVKSYSFVRKYVTIPVELKIVIFHGIIIAYLLNYSMEKSPS
jgi:hypothetical protein